MGSFFSRFRTNDDNFEQILSELDAKIYRTEINIAEANLRQRKVTTLLTTYSLLIYVLWLLSFFFLVWPKVSLRNGLARCVVEVYPVFLSPILIYSIRWIAFSYYRRYVIYQEQEHQSLKKRQKQKVEEMKQKMKYYVAKNLIERYEENEKNPSQPRRNSNNEAQSSPSASHTGSVPPAVEMSSNQVALSPTQMALPESQSTPLLSNVSNLQMADALRKTQQTPSQSMYPIQTRPFNPELVISQQRTWLDRMLDVMIGEDSPNSKYALICEKCFNHNGLAFPQEVENIQYSCPKCGHFNSKRARLGLNPGTSLQSPIGSKDDISSQSVPITPIRTNVGQDLDQIRQKLEFSKSPDSEESNSSKSDEVATSTSIQSKKTRSSKRSNNNKS